MFLKITLMFLLSLLLFVNSKFIVKSPKDLYSFFPQQKIKATISNFGLIPYGISIEGKLNFYTLISDGCQPFSFQFPIHPKVDESPILLLTLGGCSAITKILNVQQARAHAVIFINNNPNQNISDINIQDEGKGEQVTIPSLLISYEDGEILKSFYKKNINDNNIINSIKVNIEFEMEHPDNTVEYDLFYSPDDPDVYSLLRNLNQYDVKLGEHNELRIHFVTYTDNEYKEDIKTIIPNCLGSGRYCVNSHKTNEGEQVDGSEILKEMITQKCIHQYAYKNKQKYYYWEYMNKFYDNCIVKNKFTRECSTYCSIMVNLPFDKINICVRESYEATEAERKIVNYEQIFNNKILEEEEKYRKSFAIKKVPSLFINERYYLGNWRADYIFEAICAGLLQKPEICYLDTRFTKAKNKQNDKWKIGITVGIIVIINVLIFLICMRNIKRRVHEKLNETDINKRIDTIVNSYLTMNELPEQIEQS